MKVLTIERSKWRRGGSDHDGTQGPTALLNEKGLMCCLGFDALACGLLPGAIVGRVSPAEVTEFADTLPSEYVNQRVNSFGLNTLWVRAAMGHNDDSSLSSVGREAFIREDLKALGWDDVLFVD